VSGDHLQSDSTLSLVLELGDREAAHLMAVRKRFFDTCAAGTVPEEWLEQKLSTPEGIDQLESFGWKFGRLQDTIMDKILPRCLLLMGEKAGAAIDNLNRAERIGLVNDGDEWLEMRRLRNLLVHEYLPSTRRMAEVLQRARELTGELVAALERIRQAIPE